VRFCTGDADVFRAIRFLECNPEIIGDPPKELRISIDRFGSYYRILQDGQLLREQISPQGITETLHANLILLSLAEFPTAPVIHAASLRRNGHRILLVGQKGGGKTVLTLHLAQQGYQIEGDEHVFGIKAGVIARPRGLRVKESAEAVLPHLKVLLSSAAYYDADQYGKIYNLDPRQVGASTWRIEAGTVDAIVLLRPNHGGYSSLRPVPPLRLVREVLEECALPETGRADAVRIITQVVGNAAGFDMSLGDLAGATECVSEVFDRILLPECRTNAQFA
jgi:hypothetical protein